MLSRAQKIFLSMAKQFHTWLLLFLITALLSIYDSEQLQSSQFDALMSIQKDLNFPSALSSWNYNTEFCNADSNSSSTVMCYEDTITQLHIIGEARDSLLPRNFSLDSFFQTLSRLPNLKVLTLVSLGIWGPLPAKISHLTSLEIVNMSSNCLYGAIPHELSSLSNLHTLILDDNMLSGQLPDWMGSFPDLTVLSLKKNKFNGSLPKSLGSLENLRILSLSHNHLFGMVPNLSRLKHLEVLDLDSNALGPQFPKLGSKLVTLILRNNSFRSGIPSDVTSYYQLERLDISLNTFVGPFQPALLSLPSITYLNISGNKLTGMVFENMSCNSELEFVDLSSNLLTGKLPKCLVSNPNDRTVKYARNCLDGADQNQNPSPFCHTEALAVGILPERKKHKGLSKLVLSIGIAGGAVGVVALVVLIVFLAKRGNLRSRSKHPPVRYITENAASGYTSKLLSGASKFLYS